MTNLIDFAFNTALHLVALTAWSLTAYYGPIYLRTAFREGWGACREGFTRYARDMFFQSAIIAIIFGCWSAIVWEDNHSPSTALELVLVVSVPALFIVQNDLLLYAIREVRWAWHLYIGGAAAIILANLVHAGLIG